MRRRLFTFTSVLSLLLLTATVLLWVRSYWLWDELSLQRRVQRDEHGTTRTHGCSVISERGLIELYCCREQFDVEDMEYVGPPPALTSGRVSARQRRPERTFWNHLGFESFCCSRRVGAVPATCDERAWWVPQWVLVGSFAVLPVWRFVLQHKRLRCQMLPRPGMCKKCGYDLRGCFDRCPECGTPIPQKAEATA